MSQAAASPGDAPLLLCIVELGGYPDFSAVYREQGYRVQLVNSGRKAVSAIKKERPAVIVAEFNYQPDFRDRTSNLESILATAYATGQVGVIVFYDPEFAPKLDQLQERFPGFIGVPRDISAEAMAETVRMLSHAGGS